MAVLGGHDQSAGQGQFPDTLHADGIGEIAETAASEARAFVITGAGDKVFSAGADLDDAKAGLATDPVWERLSGAIAALPIPSVAALNGTLAGGAFGMALACDMRLSTAGAKFFYPVAKLGFLPQPSDPGRLARLVGPSRAKLILVAGQKIDASDALSWAWSTGSSKTGMWSPPPAIFWSR